VKAFFVTGTDTSVGKTTVACALLAAARTRGHRALAAKPVESGCELDDSGVPVPADALALFRAAAGRAASSTPPGSVYRLLAPLAPASAAAREGRAIALTPIHRACARALSLAPDFFLVEGAGGLLVPLAEGLTIADLAASLGHPLLLVARDSLGTINHTLLTVEAARRRRLSIAAVILCAAAPGTATTDAEENAREIARRSGVPVLGCLPHQQDLSPDALARAAEQHLALDRIF
jgi:dethiobiotin synthetase